MTNVYRGACLCGAVSFHYEGPSLWSAHCHCTQCQRAHGAPLVTWLGVPRDRFHLDSGAALQWYQSSAEGRRGFCSRCGSTLLFQSTRWPEEMHVARSNVAEAVDREPAAHVFWETHVDYLAYVDELPRLDSSEVK